MNKATELMIDHMIDGALWPKTQYYLQHYGSSCGGGIDMFLDNFYNDITYMINTDFDQSTQPLLIELVDMFFDDIDQREIEKAALDKAMDCLFGDE